MPINGNQKKRYLQSPIQGGSAIIIAKYDNQIVECMRVWKNIQASKMPSIPNY
jgi:hypothetical protein